jgi:hypothetical protein
MSKVTFDTIVMSMEVKIVLKYWYVIKFWRCIN